MLKLLAFKEKQKKNILEHKEKMCRKLKQETEEQQTEIESLDELLTQGRQQLDHLEKEATSMKIHCAGPGRAAYVPSLLCRNGRAQSGQEEGSVVPPEILDLPKMNFTPFLGPKKRFYPSLAFFFLKKA